MPTFLLIDDDPDDCHLFREVCSDVSDEIIVECLLDCRKLIEYLAKNPCPDIVLIDMNMPYINGMECLSIIRKTEKWEEAKIVMYSTSSRGPIIRDSYFAGANLYIVKPNEYEKMKDIVAHLLEMALTKQP